MLPTEDYKAARQQMHGNSSEERNAFLSLLQKDSKAHGAITREYIDQWNSDGDVGDVEKGRETRKGEYMSLVNNYYDLATDFYEEAWAQSFHFCRFAPGESFLQSLARHEHYLAHRIGIDSSMTVLDVGCGVGKPARQIATFTGCKVVGLNNNEYQVERATAHAIREKLEGRVGFVGGDFMKTNFPPSSFDSAYAIEATVHAPSLEGVYSQIFRVLKPGGVFGVYEWVMTDAYDDTDEHHREIRLGIERGSGIANMVPRKEALEAMRKAGFVVEHEEDLAQRKVSAIADRRPWYAPLAGDWRGAQTLGDFFGVLRMSWVGRVGVGALLRSLETLRLAPSGSAETAAELSAGADALVAGGREGLFTPMYLMVARKPLSGGS